MSADGSIHQLVGYLVAFGPAELKVLRDQNPDVADLQPGRVLGSLSAPWRVRVRVATEALRLMATQADVAALKLAGRLRTSHRVELVAQFTAAAGSGGALVALLGEGSAALQLSGAALGLAGSTTAVLVKYLRRDLSGADDGLAARHGGLVQSVGRAVELGLRLKPYELAHDDLGDLGALAALLDEANTLAGRLFQQLHQAGLAAAATPPR